MILKSTTKYFAAGNIVADSKEPADSLMVITSGQIGLELPLDSEEADEENSKPDGKTLLYIFGRGWLLIFIQQPALFLDFNAYIA